VLLGVTLYLCLVFHFSESLFSSFPFSLVSLHKTNQNIGEEMGDDERSREKRGALLS